MSDYRKRPDPFAGVDYDFSIRSTSTAIALWLGIAASLICLGALFAAVRP